MCIVKYRVSFLEELGFKENKLIFTASFQFVIGWTQLISKWSKIDQHNNPVNTFFP